jgi:hypothetical protein
MEISYPLQPLGKNPLFFLWFNQTNFDPNTILYKSSGHEIPIFLIGKALSVIISWIADSNFPINQKLCSEN